MCCSSILLIRLHESPHNYLSMINLNFKATLAAFSLAAVCVSCCCGDSCSESSGGCCGDAKSAAALLPVGAADNVSLQDYDLVWQDEFDAPRGLPNAEEWYYETGDHGWGNKEIQNYVPGILGADTCAIVDDGKLTITLKPVGDEILSVRMNTLKAWQYGYFEGRLKIPHGKGTWPAFWMMPKESSYGWPACGEIDIMEHVGYDPDVIHCTIHCESFNHKIGTQVARQDTVPNTGTEYHVYAVEWTPDFIRGFVDGKQYYEFLNDKKGENASWPFDNAFYLKLNLAWGGWGGREGLDPTVLPAKYEIDYVRVFAKP